MFATIDSPAITPDNYVIPPEKTFLSPLPPQTKNNDRFENDRKEKCIAEIEESRYWVTGVKGL